MEESRSAFKNLKGKHTGKRSSGRPRRRWEVNTRITLKEIGISTRNWVDSTQDRNYWRAFAKLVIEVPGYIIHRAS